MVREEGRGEDWHQVELNGMRWLLKRWWFWGGAGFMLVAVAAGYLLIPVGECRISQASCDKIHLGSSEEEVQELLGVPLMRLIFSHVHSTWVNEDGDAISVAFGSGSHYLKPSNPRGVTEKYFTPSSLSLWERMKRRIERRLK
jgi:hypothetical protein